MYQTCVATQSHLRWYISIPAQFGIVGGGVTVFGWFSRIRPILVGWKASALFWSHTPKMPNGKMGAKR